MGRLTKIEDASGSTEYTFDKYGNTVTDKRTIGTTVYTTTYAYDLAGKVTSTTYPSGRIVSLTYDVAGRVSGMTTKEDAGSSSETVLSGVTYLPMSEAMSGGTYAGAQPASWALTAATFGNSVDLAVSYDQNGRLTDIDTMDGSTAIQDITFAHDNAGNIISITDGLQAGASPDPASQTIETLAYSATSNRLTSVTSASTQRNYTYDAAGNTIDFKRTASTAFTLDYSKRGRLTNVKENGTQLAAYTYNAMGQRVSRDVTGAPSPLPSNFTYHTVHDLDGRLIGEVDDTGNWVREVIWLGLMPVALVDHSGAAPELLFAHTDQVMKPQKITDATGAVVWQGSYTPFGELRSVIATRNNVLMFPGQVEDGETMLSQNWHRDYDPAIGRYIQSDPIGLLGGVNTYGYALQNPGYYIDFTGENPAAPVVGILVGGARVYKVGKASLKAYRAAKAAAVASNSVSQFKDDSTEECEDECDEIRKDEDAACRRDYGYDPIVKRSCLARAAARWSACKSNGGVMPNDDDVATPWSDIDVDGWIPRPPPKKRKRRK